MGWLVNLLGGPLISKGIEMLSGFLRRRQEGRAAAQAVEAKVKLATVNKDAKLELADHELQVLRTKGQTDSWKDEYVTLIVSAPILVAVAGALVQVFEPFIGGKLLDASQKMADVMTGDTIDYPLLWGGVVAVALGTRPFRK